MADVDSSVALSGRTGTRSLSRTRDILIETMQLVEPKKEIKVPNHLLESKIYTRVAKNAVVQADPSVVHFGGFEPGVMQSQVINLVNVSTEVQKMHVVPPQSKYFYIKYTKGDRLVSGMALECTVEFTPDEWRYYYDCIRVHCKGEENLIIPIHAYPIMNTSDFPKYVTFPPVPIGHTRSRVIPLRCQAPIDFEFQLTYSQHHPAFRVEPMAGVVPANGEVDILVTFSPAEFSTARMTLQLVISQFNAKPLVCNFSGSSVPGLAKELTEKSYQQEQMSITETADGQMLDPRAISPLDRARSKKHSKAKRLQPRPPVKEIEREGVKFPVELDTPYAVSQVLNQQAGKLRIKDLREAVLSKKDSIGTPTRQMKEAMFEIAVRQNVHEERQNQLRWQVKVGDTQITSKSRQDIVEARQQAWDIYERKRGDPVEEEEYMRQCNNLSATRTRRDCSQLAAECAQFDVYKNDPWAVRHAALYKFQQAARKIIIRFRADTKLRGLRQMVLDWGDKKYNQTVTSEQKEKMDMEDDEDLVGSSEELILSYKRVTSFSFPTYSAPDVKDDMAVDALGSVPYKPTEVIVRKKVPYHNLKVPQQHQLMSYKPHNVHEASLQYVPPGLARPLRTGAEEEVISLSDAEPPQVTLGPVVESDLRLEEVESRPQTPAQVEVLPIKPPAALFKPLEYPPLHIFNPAPGLQVFQPPLPYAEIDSDFHLCPLPRYTSSDTNNPHMATQKRYLDREDTIRGVMTWKKFPSQGLTSLTNTPTMSGVWVPRWEDPFNRAMLPEAVPDLYSRLPDEDRDNAVVDNDGDDDEAVSLTPDMVLAEFPLIDTNYAPHSDDKHKKEDSFPYSNKLPLTNIPVSWTGPVPREKREQELDYYLRNKYNRLGKKIHGRITQVNNLKTDPTLILK